MLLNYKYRIYPNEEQVALLEHWIGICRQQYNSALLDRKNHYRNYKKGLSLDEQKKIQTNDKKLHSALRGVPSQPLQEVLYRLDRAYQKFFKKDGGYPKLKKHKDYRSITFTQFGIGVQRQKGKIRKARRAVSFGKNGCLLISKCGEIPIVLHRKLDGRVKQVIIKQNLRGEWYAILCVDRQATTPAEKAAYSIGLDVGIKKFLVDSKGNEVENPKFLRQSEKKLHRLQQSLSRKTRGSANRQKALAKVQKLHERIANQRRDFLHKQSNKLAKAYAIICVENLNIRGMKRNRKLAKSIHDVGWGMFRQFLKYKTLREGGLLVLVKPHYTTINCSGCSNPVQKTLSVRTHICTKCGLILDRDHNAAINIENAGLALL